MAQIIAPGVVRFTVNALYAGHTVANILDMELDSMPLGGDREDHLEQQAGIIINQWTEDIMNHLSNQYVAQSVSWLDLDSEDGSTGERTSSSGSTWPTSGAGPWEPMPGNVALRVNKVTTAKRGQRQGRMYLAGFAEAGSSQGQPNMVTPGTLTSLTTMLDSFLENLNQNSGEGGGGGYDSGLVVVHTKNGEYTDFSVVNSLSPDPFLSSQVRRIRR